MSVMTVALKHAGEPLEMDRLTAFTAHAAGHRCAMFEAKLAEERKVTDYLGIPINDRDPPEHAGAFVIRDIWALESARAFLARVGERIASASSASD